MSPYGERMGISQNEGSPKVVVFLLASLEQPPKRYPQQAHHVRMSFCCNVPLGRVAWGWKSGSSPSFFDQSLPSEAAPGLGPKELKAAGFHLKDLMQHGFSFPEVLATWQDEKRERTPRAEALLGVNSHISGDWFVRNPSTR